MTLVLLRTESREQQKAELMVNAIAEISLAKWAAKLVEDRIECSVELWCVLREDVLAEWTDGLNAESMSE